MNVIRVTRAQGIEAPRISAICREANECAYVKKDKLALVTGANRAGYLTSVATS